MYIEKAAILDQLDSMVDDQRTMNQLIEQILPDIQAAWDARVAELSAELEHELDHGVIRTTLNAAALEQLVPQPEGLNQAAAVRFRSKVNAIRSNAMTVLYETLL
jgi:hypothetical protein